jgi:adenylylsulfate kinase
MIENIFSYQTYLAPIMRSQQKKQKPCLVWFTGLSSAGKSTIANAVEHALYANGFHTYLLDGDNIRHGLSKDLSFSDEDRVENIRRVGEVAKLFLDAGLIVLAAFISPFLADRKMVRDLFCVGEYVEIFVDAPLSVCEERDPKGLYKKARAGFISKFTGIDSPYEKPENPDIILDTVSLNLEECVDRVLGYLYSRNNIQLAEMHEEV